MSLRRAKLRLVFGRSGKVKGSSPSSVGDAADRLSCRGSVLGKLRKFVSSSMKANGATPHTRSLQSDQMWSVQMLHYAPLRRQGSRVLAEPSARYRHMSWSQRYSGFPRRATFFSSAMHAKPTSFSCGILTRRRWTSSRRTAPREHCSAVSCAASWASTYGAMGSSSTCSCGRNIVLAEMTEIPESESASDLAGVTLRESGSWSEVSSDPASPRCTSGSSPVGIDVAGTLGLLYSLGEIQICYTKARVSISHGRSSLVSNGHTFRYSFMPSNTVSQILQDSS